jgi:hypothetical protein
MRPGNVNATHCRVIGSLLSQGVPYEEIVEKVVTATLHMAVMLELKDWTREAEFKFVRDCMVGLLKGRCQKEQNPSPAPNLGRNRAGRGLGGARRERRPAAHLLARRYAQAAAIPGPNISFEGRCRCWR